MAECAGPETGTERSPEEQFVSSADAVVDAATDAVVQVQGMSEAQPARRGGRPGAAQGGAGGATPDPLAELRTKVADLDAQLKKLRAHSRPSSR
jgi:hypothetical protein